MGHAQQGARTRDSPATVAFLADSLSLFVAQRDPNVMTFLSIYEQMIHNLNKEN